jgi:predicted membrane protein
VAAQARAQAAASIVFEQRLLRALVVVFALSAAAVVAWFGRGWAVALAANLPGGQGALGWCALVACCALGNWGIGVLRRCFEHAPHTAN